MKVYHGSTTRIEHPLVKIGRKHLDFGQGFYITDVEQQAIDWAKRPLNRGKEQILNIYNLEMDKILLAGFRYKRFESYDNEWLQFVIANRQGQELWKDYDIIEGGVANDRVFNTIELLTAGLIPQEEALHRLKFEKPNNQLCILNQHIVDNYLHFVDSAVIGKETQHG